MLEMRRYLEAARAQIDVVVHLKRLHDGLHSLQVQCYDQVARELQRFPDDPSAEVVVREAARAFQDHLDVVIAVFRQARNRAKAEESLDLLRRRSTTCGQGSTGRSSHGPQALWGMGRVSRATPLTSTRTSSTRSACWTSRTSGRPWSPCGMG